MNIFKRRIFKLLPWLFALLLLIPLKMVQQRNLDRALLRELSYSYQDELYENVNPLPTIEVLLHKGARHDAQADLFIGILRGDAAQVEAALINGAKVNLSFNPGTTPLNYAVERESSAVVRVLLTHDANVNAVDADAVTPLFNAVVYHNLENVKLLLNNGAKVNATNGLGETALDKAVWTTEGKDGMILHLLLNAGAKSFSNPKLRHQLLAGEMPDSPPPS